jgi:amino acid transporter
MAAETAGVAVTKPTDVGFKRELGLIGATWASETSIIGSGWLFGALFAAQAVGGAAVLAWVIAGIMIIILALCHAELGAMFPVSGGTARFPHFAFGSVAGVGFGFFAYMQAVTIAPIECFAFMQYASYYWPSIYDSTTKNVTGIGFILTVILMAIFVAVNFLAMRIFARVNNVITWWKVAVPVLAIIVLLTHWHTGNFTAGGTGFMPGGIKARGHHLRLLRLRAVRPAGRGDQEPGAQPASGDRHLGPDRHRDLLPAAGGVHRRAAAGYARQPRWPDRPLLPRNGNV